MFPAQTKIQCHNIKNTKRVNATVGQKQNKTEIPPRLLNLQMHNYQYVHCNCSLSPFTPVKK